jgi:hypothetical protein
MIKKYVHDSLLCLVLFSTCSAPAFTMVLATTICIPKTLNEVLSVTEDATYDEIRAAYKSAALNTHPDKSTDNSPVIG